MLNIVNTLKKGKRRRREREELTKELFREAFSHCGVLASKDYTTKLTLRQISATRKIWRERLIPTVLRRLYFLPYPRPGIRRERLPPLQSMSKL